MHTLIVSNPGHFHAALALRNRHPLLADNVYVYAEAGADLERFLGLVEAFNTRPVAPTAWKLHVYRGHDHLDRLIVERKGDVVLMAGRNQGKLPIVSRLQEAGFAVLCDKTWLIDQAELPWIERIVTRAPLAIDMMTERHDVGHRILRTLSQDADVFGDYAGEHTQPAITLWSLHHLFKKVNGAPLKRPAWYFDTAVQGEGITDVTTHLSDMALLLTDRGAPARYGQDLQLRKAQQWPTLVPLPVYTTITGEENFPAGMAQHVSDRNLAYLCNARVGFTLRGVDVEMEAVWGLEEPAHGADAFRTVLRGTRATLALLHDDATGFESVVKVIPAAGHGGMRRALEVALARHADTLPGLTIGETGGEIRILIPAGITTTHEQHFAKVLDAFLQHVADRQRPQRVLDDLLAKYTLLARARQMSHA